MTLATLLAHFVDWRVRERGRAYFQSGRVEVSAVRPEKVEAVVSGSQRYAVSLTRNGGDLRVNCSCPYFAGGELCKHVWAVVLEADEQKGLLGPEGDLPNRITMSGSPQERVRPEPPATTWRDALHQLTASDVPTPALTLSANGKEILYLLDVPATLKSTQLTVRAMTGWKDSDGSWQGVTALSLSRNLVSQLAEPDRTILGLLGLVAAAAEVRSYSVYSNQVPAVSPLPPEAAGILLPLLDSTDRFWTRPDKDSKVGAPIVWDAGPPWEIWLEVREIPGGDCVLKTALRRGKERISVISPPVVLGSSGFLLVGDRLAPLADAGSRWTALLAPEKALVIPAADRGDLVSRLLASPHLPQLDLPDSMRFTEARPAPRPFLRLLPPPWSRTSPRAALSFLYEGSEVASSSPLRGLYQPAERRYLLRDPAAEAQGAARLWDLGFRAEQDSYSYSPAPMLQIPANRVSRAVFALLAEGWAVEAEGKLYRSAGRFRMSITSGVDWFDLHGEADFDGETVPLPEVLQAIRRGAKSIVLGDGSLGMLPDEWIQKFAPIARLGTTEGDHVRFGSVQAVLLDAWLADEPAVTCDEAFERARQRLREFAGVAPAEAPPGFKGELRGYQRAGLGWLHFLRDFGFGGCLADDMGLGKTVQVLALLESRRTQRKRQKLPPSLAVVPRSLVFNWLAEAARFTPRLRVLDHTGAGRTRKGDPFADCDLVLTTYGTLRKDVAALREVEFDYLILDEAQAIKNADSLTAKAARLLRGRHRLALTGTPVENHLGELWSLLEFLNPGFLGSLPSFRGFTEDLRAPFSESRGMLVRALRPLLLRRTKEAVAPELPPKLEQTLFCELPPKQRRFYDELRDHYRASLGARIGAQGLGRSKILVLEALLRLRQAACHPGLVDPRLLGDPCAKLDLLLPQLREVVDEGHKALVFSQFTSFLAILRPQLEAEGLSYLYLDGRTRNRAELVAAFQTEPGCQLFLISLKAGGLGLNMTAADYVYLLDPWWNPAVEAQAIDRTHRIGQERPVFASRLVARDTVEEKILDLQKTKRDLADAVIEADKSLLAGLSREDLELLLS
jgi:superfamily II DNA or RNA helicase